MTERGRGWATARRPCEHCGGRIRVSSLVRHEAACTLRPDPRPCAVTDCERVDIKGHGLCRLHYSRLRKHGTTDDPLNGKLDFRREGHPPTSTERFWQKVEAEPNTGCWLWLGAASKLGYGRFQEAPAHHFLYVLQHGPIAEGLELDHLCRTPSCVNPAHLEAVTHAENTRRHFRLQTHCKHGHPLSGPNLCRRRDGTRACRTCRKEFKRAWDVRRRSPQEVQLT